MRIGDNVICVRPGCFNFGEKHYGNVAKKLKSNSIYVVKEITEHTIKIDGISNQFTKLRFIELKDYRKQKLKKIDESRR